VVSTRAIVGQLVWIVLVLGFGWYAYPKATEAAEGLEIADMPMEFLRLAPREGDEFFQSIWLDIGQLDYAWVAKSLRYEIKVSGEADQGEFPAAATAYNAAIAARLKRLSFKHTTIYLVAAFLPTLAMVLYSMLGIARGTTDTNRIDKSNVEDQPKIARFPLRPSRIASHSEQTTSVSSTEKQLKDASSEESEQPRTEGMRQLFLRRCAYRISAAIIAAWIIGCISTTTDPTKIYLIFSEPLGIAGIMSGGLGGLIGSFAIVGLPIFGYAKIRKTSVSFYVYLGWSSALSALSALMLAKP
jgi:hypothetical protein